MHAVLLVLFFAGNAAIGATSSPVVNTFYGPVEGIEYALSDGNTANVFLGIPFAKAPIGELRFETFPFIFRKPKKLDKWTETFRATEFGASCPPHHRSLMQEDIIYNEDCLTLNIMAPAKKSSDPIGYPVMVFIHGGFFETDTATTYDYRNISENFVREGVVFVTFNYRLSALGFFSTGDHYVPGNLGLWDQTMALHFVQEVISDFGGNPHKVTLLGDNAGAVSVSGLTYSPHANSLFHQAILMSGSIYCPWGKNERVVDVSHMLAQTLKCKGNSEAILYCMREKSVDEILDGIEKIGSFHDHLFPYIFHPRFDGEFFIYDFDTLITELPPIPIIAGVNSLEAGPMIMDSRAPALHKIGIHPSEWTDYTMQKLKTFIEEKTHMKGDSEDLKENLIKFYAERPMEEKEKLEEMDWKDALERFTLLVSDLHYVFPIYKEAMTKTSLDIPVYLYIKEYFTSSLQPELPIKGEIHGNELFFLSLNEHDRAFQKNMLEGFIGFVKTGQPVVNGVQWIPITKKGNSQYMSLGTVGEMKDEFMKESIDFWKQKIAIVAEKDHIEL